MAYSRTAQSWQQRLVLTLALLLSCAALPVAARPVPAASENSARKLHEEQHSTRARQQAVREQLFDLKQNLAQTEAQRNAAASALAEVERTISTTNLNLRRLAQQQNILENRLNQLRQEADTTQTRIRYQQTRLGLLLQRQYMKGQPETLRVLFNGENPSQNQRSLHYLGYISKANLRWLQEMRQDLLRVRELAGAAHDKQTELASLRSEQENEKKILLSEQDKRQHLLTSLARQAASQKQRVEELQRDEQRLSRLVEGLTKKIAQQLARERTRSARPPTQARPNAEKGAGKMPATIEDGEGQPAALGDFANLRGHLKLPVRGQLSGRFGATRNQIGAQGGTTWKGLFILAAQGSPVRAIAAGRVVFADWLRGFGNLLIVDHGHQYLSIYGNNEHLHKQTGQTVQPGETIASVGNSGGNPEIGLYFELRHQGQPFDPLKWTGRP